ncbi:uncharacterized protein LOC144361205 [Saccoglossus kowalevskii]
MAQTSCRANDAFWVESMSVIRPHAMFPEYVGNLLNTEDMFLVEVHLSCRVPEKANEVDNGVGTGCDFLERIQVIAPTNGNKCYAATLNTETEEEPSKLKEILLQDEKEGKLAQYGEDKDMYYSVSGTKIKDFSGFGEAINNACEGRDMYWLDSVNHTDGEMMKRGCWYIRVCWRVRVGWWWVRVCASVLIC